MILRFVKFLQFFLLKYKNLALHTPTKFKIKKPYTNLF